MIIALDLRMHPEARRRNHGQLGQLAVAARNQADLPWGENAAPGAHLAEVLTATQAHASALGLQNSPIMARFARRVAEHDCDSCGLATGGLTCTDQASAALLHPSGGRCFSLLFDLFATLVSLADEFYGEDAGGATPTLDITLNTQVSRTSDLGGMTRFPQAEAVDARAAEVTIDLPSEHLDERHFGHLPYIMFHEIFVHAPESMCGAGGREPSDEENAFREGFMDRAAFKLLEARLWEGGGQMLPEPLRKAYQHIIQESRQAHHRRVDFGVAPDGRDRFTRRIISYVLDRRTGLEVFDLLEKSFDIDIAIRLASQLNVAPLSPQQQAKMLQLIERAGEAQLRSGPINSAALAWLGRLRRAAQDGDVVRIGQVIDAEEIDEEDY